MRRGIVGNFSEFQKVLPKGIVVEKNSERIEAVRNYISSGGILSLSPNGNDWPNLIFPTRRHIELKLSSLKELRQGYRERLNGWKAKHLEAKVYHIANNLKKLKEPLYWQHLAKYVSDPDYRTDSEKVKLPVHLVSDAKWKPMVKMFISDLEYRKQLAETVETSVVYQKDRRVAKYANVLQEFRMQESQRKITELEKKLSEIEEEIKTLNTLLKWASL